jgi:hypothetical protein
MDGLESVQQYDAMNKYAAASPPDLVIEKRLIILKKSVPCSVEYTKKRCSTHGAQNGIALVPVLELFEAQSFIPVPVIPPKNTLDVLPSGMSDIGGSVGRWRLTDLAWCSSDCSSPKHNL